MFHRCNKCRRKKWICCMCLKYVKNGKMPPCCIANGLEFPTIPEELKLTKLEERLVSPRLVFMQLREMPRGGQINLKGNIVNVPADVNNTVRQLPRMLDDSETIAVKFKRKLCYKHHVSYEKVRPNKVMEAAKWLVQNSPLFQSEGIVVDDLWVGTPTELENDETVIVRSNKTGQDKESMETSAYDKSDSDEWTEDENFHERLTGNTDTVLQSADFREFNQILSLAPGEKNTPLGLFQDINSEYLAFPTIYCGKARPDNSDRQTPLHYSTICKWELRNVDRRVATNIPNIFFKLKRLQIKQIKDKVMLAVRKCKTKGKKMTAHEVLSPGFVDNIVKQDDGFRVLRNLRGSPPYWEKAKKDVFAMIRQLGIPTWFCSFSAAETKWFPLLGCLSKLVHGKELNDSELENLTWQDKCHLIKSDPVTCARYFDHKFQIFVSHVLKHELKPIGEIVDFFFRVEFQQRGSPHVHMLIWIKNFPVYGSTNEDDVGAFIDKYITCSKSGGRPELINYQTHRHARTCRKKGRAICRFNFPLPPIPSTRILDPITDVEIKSEGLNNFQKIASYLSQMKLTDSGKGFESFPTELGIDEESYIYALRATLTTSKVFLKRNLEETIINNYNSFLLESWEANVDIQYI